MLSTTPEWYGGVKCFFVLYKLILASDGSCSCACFVGAVKLYFSEPTLLYSPQYTHTHKQIAPKHVNVNIEH